MLKYKYELMIIVILIPILAYVAWQAYNSYFKAPAIEELEKAAKEAPARQKAPPVIEQPPVPSASKGTLDYAGFTERDPLKTSLPVKEKIEKPKEGEKPLEKKPGELQKKEEASKEILLPTFAVTGIVWGYSPRVILDNSVYKIGDIVKGAKIMDITNKGIRMIYEDKEFWISL